MVERDTVSKILDRAAGFAKALAIAEAHKAAGPACVLLANRAAYKLQLDQLIEARTDAIASLSLARSINLHYVLPLAIQHIASIYSRTVEFRSSAILTGFVDAWYKRNACAREPTERRSYEELMVQLHGKLRDEEMMELKSIGEHLEEQDAFAELERLFVQDIVLTPAL